MHPLKWRTAPLWTEVAPPFKGFYQNYGSLPRSAVVHDTMGYRIFLFFCRRSPYSKQFSEYGGAKVLNARIFLFYRSWVADFCFAPPNEKNQKVGRNIKRLSRKIKLFLDIYLPRFSSSPGRVNVPADFDTIEKPSRGQNRRKRHKARAFEVKCWLRKPLFALFSYRVLPFQNPTVTL